LPGASRIGFRENGRMNSKVGLARDRRNSGHDLIKKPTSREKNAKSEVRQAHFIRQNPTDYNFDKTQFIEVKSLN